MRRFLKRLFLAAIGCFLGLALLEALCSIAAWYQFGTVDVSRLNELDAGNIYVHEMRHPTALANAIKPHPWLGIVPRVEDQADSSRWKANDVANFPLGRDSEVFTVLLAGGSVAQLMGVSGEGNGPSFLETALAERLGRRVRVLNAGQGASTEPRPAIAAMLFGDRVDAMIVLAGYNESFSLTGDNVQLGNPGQWFADMNPMAGGSYDLIGASWQANALKRFSLRANSRAVFYATRAMRKQLEASAEKSKPRSDFTLPDDWPRDKKIDHNLQQFRKYVGLTDGVCEKLGVSCVHFVQPVPAIGKVLTAEEQRAVGDLSYAATYRRMADELLALNKDGIDVVSLLDCFDGVTETVYLDAVHCRVDSEGYKIIAERIADECARRWKAENPGRRQ